MVRGVDYVVGVVRMAELKPCPFCGCKADFRTENFGARVWVQCSVCGVATSRYDTNLIVCGKGGKEWAREAWNRRAEDGR